MMINRRQALLWGAAGGLLVRPRRIWSAVEASEAEKLKGPLTPFGAERAGNADGSIPPWKGGHTQVPPGYKTGQPRPDLFPDDRPLYRVTAANVGKYSDVLTEGVKTLFQRFPSFAIDVYPARRTAAAPDWIYESTLANASRARTRENGLVVEGAFGGIPFPIPRSGAEVMWNHLLNWHSESGRYRYSTYIVTSGRPVLSTAGIIETQSPYYDRDGSIDRFGGIAALVRLTVTAPPLRVGENLVVHDPVDQAHVGRKSWQYLVGQRRVRRAPNISYDNPSNVTSGFTFVDESYLFNGALDRYDWKTLGKKELLVPYNTERFHTRPVADVLGPQHPNPAHVRWERHRVWVVEATLAAGKRHVIPRRRFYFDEDTWLVLLSDGWDARGQLWHVGHALPFSIPEAPAVLSLPYVMFDLVKGGYVASSLFNGTNASFEVVPRRPEDYFSPAALAAAGVR